MAVLNRIISKLLTCLSSGIVGGVSGERAARVFDKTERRSALLAYPSALTGEGQGLCLVAGGCDDTSSSASVSNVVS